MLGMLQLVQQRLRQPAWLVTTSFLAACCVAGIVTLAMGVPVPRVHDEFAYLLGADTYASGRIVNPAHAHWQHFETFHVLTSPVYLPKYAPGQSLILTAGQLMGHPYIGVCLSTGLAAASLAWMLAGWLPRRFSWLVWLIAVLHPGLQIKWGHSYMGGAVGMIGACLLLGALGYSRQKLSFKRSAIAALGIVILANSRPFEGAVLAACVGLSLMATLKRSGRWNMPQLIRSLLVPSGIVLACGAIVMMINNYRVTGRVAELPYQLYETQYGFTPLFLWQGPKAQLPSYRHSVMERYYKSEDAEIQAKFSHPVNILREKTKSLADLIHFFGGGTQFMLLLGLPLALRRSRYRLVVCILIPVSMAAVATPWTLTHYAAPAAPLIILVILAGLTEISRLIGKGAPGKNGPTAVEKAEIANELSPPTCIASASTAIADRSSAPQIILVAIGFLLLLLHSLTLFKHDQRTNQIRWAQRRQEILQQLSQQPGKHLVFICYSANHNPHEEWVYNRADIDQAPVVWARQISPEADAQLVRYFAQRKVSFLDADRLVSMDANQALRRRPQPAPLAGR